uniref:Transcription factor Iwr1 domain-containing protein n=1 Tax=Trypanosoma congolense (strain IL3000) TaxID=1068625 RepID=G0UXK7_TRYCI|nr:conserved hypothetical protein [Trypanosoma congolense IL3000]
MVMEEVGPKVLSMPRPLAVFMRLKRPRCDGSGDVERMVPPKLRVRIGGNGAETVGREAETFVSDLVSFKPSGSGVLPTEERQSQRSFCFNRVTNDLFNAKDERVLPCIDGPPSTSAAVAAGNDTLVVERVWNVRGCVVMDCTMVGSELSAPPAEAVDPCDSCLVDRRALLDGCEGDWPVYVLDKNSSPTREEWKTEVASVDEEQDDFGFDDLHISQDGGGLSTPLTTSGPCASCRPQRKRVREMEGPHYILSLSQSLCGSHVSESEAIRSLQNLLQGFRDDFLLDDNKGFDPELYMYPDHRKDDEYDSNAADLSANEYPDESSSVDTASDMSVDDEGRCDTRAAGSCLLYYDDYGQTYEKDSFYHGWCSSDDGY